MLTKPYSTVGSLTSLMRHLLTLTLIPTLALTLIPTLALTLT